MLNIIQLLDAYPDHDVISWSVITLGVQLKLNLTDEITVYAEDSLDIREYIRTGGPLVRELPVIQEEES